MINIGIGIGWAKAIYSVANNIIANFKARVATYPGSIFEAGPCLDATLEELNAIGLLDNASLVITPNAYNEGLLYDVIPNTTLGDMDVVRATTATRVNELGLIEVVPRNLVTYSEQFDNASWPKVNILVIPNTAISPNGTLNADTLKEQTTANTVHRLVGNSVNVGTNSNISYSLYVKKNTLEYLRIVVNDVLDTTKWAAAQFNLNDQTYTTGIGSSGGSTIISASITNVGSGWVRINLSANLGTTQSVFPIMFTSNGQTINPTDTRGAASYIGSDKELYIWGAQMEQSSTATEYFPTTTRLNIPRIDYTNGTCPSLLVEPQRTNLFTYSEQFDDVSWSKTAISVFANTTISPSNSINAETITPSGSGYHNLSKTVSTTGTVSYKVYAKYNGYNLWLQMGVNSGSVAFFNLQNGTTINNATFPATYGSGFTQVSKSIIALGNGWYECNLVATGSVTIFTIGVAKDENNATYTADGTSGVYLWGAQLEQGSYPTSYIPTVASTVTRNADVISKTGISSLIGQTEGTIFVDVDIQNPISNSGNWHILMVGTPSERITLYTTSFGTIIGTDGVSVTGGYAPIIGSLTLGRNKIAIAYKTNDVAFYINGTLIGTQSTANIPLSMSQIDLGGNFIYSGYIAANQYNAAQLYKTRLSNSELAQLTTL